MLPRSCCAVWILLTAGAAAAVFVEKPEASGVLQRRRRANSGFLEEVQQGNLERECIEEICNYEEAREVFEEVDTTRRFWQTYKYGDPCLINPCHNGTCVVTGSTHRCDCAEGFGGRYCETVVEDLLKCLYHNGLCEHFCDGSGETTRCFCADGYKLGPDGRQCVAQVDYPCGRLPPEEAAVNQSAVVQTRLVGSNHCPRGACPWQVLVQLDGNSHCGGVLVAPDWVVTAAHCIHGNAVQSLAVVAGEHNLDVDDGTEQEIPVAAATAHPDYDVATGDSDVALLRLRRPAGLNRFVLPVCLPTAQLAESELLRVRYHTVSGWGRRTAGGNGPAPGAAAAPTGPPPSPFLRTMSVPILPSARCAQRAQFNFTANMLCAGYLGGRRHSCRGDDGSPLVTLYGSTHFLTGVVGWGRGCAQPGYYGVYANMANFVQWVEAAVRDTPTAPPASDTPAQEAVMLEQEVVQ